jgi:hypothetical protein
MPRGTSPLDEAQLQRRLWTPRAAIGNLAAWYRFSDPATLTVSGGNVTGARDLRGIHDLTSAGAGNLAYSAALGELAWAGNLPTWPGSSIAYLFAAGLAGLIKTTQKPQVIALCRTAGGTTTRTLFALRAWPDAESGGWGSPFADLCGRGTSSFTTGNGRNVNIAYSLNTWFLWSQQFDINQPGGLPAHEVFRDGAMSATASFASIGALGTTGNRLRIGQGSPNQSGENWNGQIAEIVILGDGNDPLRRLCEGYIAWGHGVQHKLPAAHPFRNRPPLIGD